MSSILKALKKIEGESPPPQTYPSLPKPIDPEQALNSNTRRRRRFSRVFYLLLFLLLIIVAAAIVFNHRRVIIAGILSAVSSQKPAIGEASNASKTNVYRAKVSAPSEKQGQKIAAAARRPKTQPPNQVPDTSDKKYRVRTNSNNRRLIGSKPPAQTSADKAEPKAVFDSRVKRPVNKASQLPGSKRANKSAARQNTKKRAPVTRDRQSAQIKPQVTYDRIDNPKLKLQALAWSDEASRRMAVINGRIVHEGESVDGYQVIKIREEDVVVNEGGKSWRLVFGLQ